MRSNKPPTRRQLASKIMEAVPAINTHSHNLDVVRLELDALDARVGKLELAAVEHIAATGSRWKRLQWVWRG